MRREGGDRKDLVADNIILRGHQETLRSLMTLRGGGGWQ